MSVKVYISNEIRRFPLAAYPSFGSLLGKIQSFSDDVNGKRMKIHWKDAENELIRVTCDEDWREAKTHNPNSQLLRLYVSMDGDSPPLDSNRRSSADGKVRGSQAGATADQAVHPGVCCDGCNGPVFGQRFKCVVCDDFDLCAVCAAQHKHSEHPMLRVCSPLDNAWKIWLPKIHHQVDKGEIFSKVAELLGNARQSDELNGGEYLKKVGDALSSIMKSFGVEVDYEIRPPRETEGQQIPQANGQSEQKNSATTNPVEPTATPEQRDFTAVNDWIMLDGATGNDVGRVDLQPSTPLYPNNAVTSPELDALVNRSLANMQSMGFVNNGDLLKNLLYQKNGDISAVLDALNLNSATAD